MTQTRELTTAEQYLAAQQANQDEDQIVDVTLPSGSVFKFKKPSKFAVLFGLGDLPQVISSMAVESWTEEGIMKAAIESGDSTNLAKMLQASLKIRDMVLDLSVSPKLVIGNADPAKNELSTDNVADDDLAFPLRWAQSGGQASDMLATFPQGRGQGPAAGDNRKERRAAAKRAGRN